MPAKVLSLAALAALILLAALTWVVMSALRQPAPGPAPALAPVAGAADFKAIDDLRVGGAKIILCGVAYTGGAAVRDIAAQAARREFQGRRVVCAPVGGGTPCDGRAPVRFRGATVAQCRTEDGRDIAAVLSGRQILCDHPAHSGGFYTACR